ncbi:hypothetical protein CPL00375_CDS0004 [Klebsiella phage Keithstache]|uniref:Uncharacterized protein n=1 Tax=Klebsiella phage Keithstache TaxID=3098264 RepID=A0ABZ2EP98_9CAUD
MYPAYWIPSVNLKSVLVYQFDSTSLCVPIC